MESPRVAEQCDVNIQSINLTSNGFINWFLIFSKREFDRSETDAPESIKMLTLTSCFDNRIQQQYSQGKYPTSRIETSRNITARVIERDTSGEIYYFLEDSRGFRTPTWSPK
ncbi:hypothetical protein TNCV_3987071 [Trichonephila clavipes]|nr:hypothetical protein TNCV_3987071 [Trichonephila clavipes]